jgi:hypothetical protein
MPFGIGVAPRRVVQEVAVPRANRPPKEQPTKEPAEGSRRTVAEALRRSESATKKPPERKQTQKDVRPGRHALDD